MNYGKSKFKILGKSVRLIFYMYSQNEKEIENQNFCV